MRGRITGSHARRALVATLTAVAFLSPAGASAGFTREPVGDPVLVNHWDMDAPWLASGLPVPGTSPWLDAGHLDHDALVDRSGMSDLMFASHYTYPPPPPLTGWTACQGNVPADPLCGRYYQFAGGGTFGRWRGANDPYRDFPFASLEPITSTSAAISLWVKTTQTNTGTDWWAVSGPPLMAHFSYNFKWGAFLRHLPGRGTVIKAAWDDGNGRSVQLELYGATPVNDDQWHHVLVTFTRTARETTGTARIYIDGILDAEGAQQTSALFHRFGPSSTDPITIRVGGWDCGWSCGSFGNQYPGFMGGLDEVQVYSGDFTAQHARALFESQSRARRQLDARVTNPRVHYGFETPHPAWIVNQSGVGGMARFASTDPSANLAGYTPGPTTTSYAYENGRGCASARIQTPFSFTLTTWIKTTPGASTTIMSNADWSLELANGVPRATVTGTTLQRGKRVDDGQWHHIALRRTSINFNGEISLMVDGTIEATATTSPYLPGLPDSSIWIGCSPTFTGQLDEIRIYADPLDDTTIRALKDADPHATQTPNP